MSAGTKIEWCDFTFNPWWGCQRVSPGCEHCYAETFAKRLGKKVWGPSAERRFFGDAHWDEPLKWAEAARKAGVRRRVFCASMADVFEDRRDLDDQRTRLWELIRSTPELVWLLLTKRPENMASMLPWNDLPNPWPNVWLGCTAEDQKRADERIPLLLETHALVRFISYEPALSSIDLFAFLKTPLRDEGLRALHCHEMPGIDWVIVGGESGPGARPFDMDWARSVVEQCKAAGVSCFTKQFGSRPVDGNYKTGVFAEHDKRSIAAAEALGYPSNLVMLRDRKGGDLSEIPGEWPREFPR